MDKLKVLLLLVLFSCKHSSDYKMVEQISKNLRIISYYDSHDRLVKKEVFDSETNLLKGRELRKYHNESSDVYSYYIDFFENGNKYIELFSINEEVIVDVFYYKNGNKFQLSDDLNERWYFWYENGQLMTISDNKTGKYFKFYNNGNIKEKGFMKDYANDSIWKYYSPQGNLIQILNYNKGKAEEVIVLDEKAINLYFKK